MRILAADDDLTTRLTIKGLLTKWGYEVELVASGDLALEVLQQDLPPRLAILDWNMPGMDGIDICRAIRENPGQRYVYIIMLSSRENIKDIVSVFEAGADDYISKPFNSEELRIRVNSGKRLVTLESELADKIEKISRFETELRHSQKMESVGQLASGVAHEINTPIQFIGDSVHFLRDGFADLSDLIQSYQQCLQQCDQEANPELRQKLEEAEEDADLPYLQEQVPKALDRTLDGIDRVAAIVRALKEFAHPDSKTMTAVDMNRAIESTLVVARNEYKYVANVEFDKGAIPTVLCNAGDINQVLLNIIVNSAQAIEQTRKSSEEMGTIHITTEESENAVIISLTDSGGGIPEEIQEKVFDPFFTTKAVGVGSGQGLAIAHTIIKEQHNGTLSFESRPGEGTTFRIGLPLQVAATEGTN